MSVRDFNAARGRRSYAQRSHHEAGFFVVSSARRIRRAMKKVASKAARRESKAIAAIDSRD